MSDDLRSRWQDWERLPYPASQYPPGSEAGRVAGVDLALTDGDAAAIFHQFFTSGQLPHGEDHLQIVLRDLDRALPALRDPARTYFKEAADLLRAIHDRLAADRATRSGQPVPPIVVVDDTRTATLYRSVEEAEASMEAIDVIDGGVYEEVFDRQGMRLVPRADGYSDPVQLLPPDPPQDGREELRAALLRTVALLPGIDIGRQEDISIEELLAVLEDHERERRRRSLMGRLQGLAAAARILVRRRR